MTFPGLGLLNPTSILLGYVRFTPESGHLRNFKPLDAAPTR